MIRLRPQLPWFSRLALGLLLALALVPSLSRSLADADAAGPWAELCSSLGAGVGLLRADVGPDDRAPALGLQGEHCPLCHNPPLAPPLEAFGTVPLLVRATAHPPLFAQAPRPLFAWQVARPRGPPSAV